MVLGKRATTGEEKRVLYTLCSVLVCAISHGRRFWPITLTRLTGIYPERECAYYRPHTVADILDLVTARVTIHEYFDVLLEKKNKSRKKGLVSHWTFEGIFKYNHINDGRILFGIFLLGIKIKDIAFSERFSKNTVKYSQNSKN